MADLSGGASFVPIGTDPDLQSARQRAINQAVAPDTEAAPPEHPAVTYARNLLSPMGPYGGPSTVSMPLGFNPYAAPADQRGAAVNTGVPTVPTNYQYPRQDIVGPDLSQIASDPSNPVGWLKQQLDKVGETPVQYVGPGLLGKGPPQGSQRPTTIGDIGAMFAPPTQAQSDNPLFALGPEGNFAGNIAEAAGPVLGQALNKGLGAAQAAFRPNVLAAAGKDIGAGEGTNLERMLAQGADQTKLPARAASDVADAAAGRVPTTDVSVTNVRPGYTRLYRGVHEPYGVLQQAARNLPTAGQWFTDDLKYATQYAEEGPGLRIQPGAGQVHYVDVPTADLPKYQGDASFEYVLPTELRANAKPLVPGTAGPRYAVEVGKTRSVIKDIQTGETLPQVFTGKDLGASAAQAKADALNAPTPVNPFAVPQEASVRAAVTYVTKAKANPVGDTVGDVVRRAARSNPEIVTPEFLASQADVRTQIDKALTTAKLPVNDENAVAVARQLLAQEKARPSVGNLNAQKVRDALGAPEEPPISFGPEPPAAPPVPPAAPPPPTRTGGAMPPDVPLPMGPTRGGAGDFAKNLVAEIAALPRALKAGLDLSAVLLQGAPLITKDITKLPFYAYTKLRGGAQRPYFASAIGQMFRAVGSGEARVQQITQGFRDSLAAEGFTGKNVPHIADPGAAFGNLTAREEYMVGDLTTKIPILGLGYRQGNYAYATLLNGLRTGEALNLARAAREVGVPVNYGKITHFVDIATGRGDLPFADSEVSKQVATAMSNVFFGPRLMTSSWQNAVDNIAALRNIGKSVISRKALDPADVARIHTTVAFVAAGVGAMKLAEASGLPIGTDPTKTDFGRITLPDGARLDLWGPFNENARLVAREIEYVQNSLNGVTPKYGQKNGLDELVNYFRGRLNPPVGIGADLLAGKTGGGVPVREAYTSADPNVNPLIPAPFSVGTALNASKTGGALGAAEAGLGVLGASVLPPSQNVNRDGLGVAEGTPTFSKDPVLDEFVRLAKADPNFDKDGFLPPPDTTLGTGRYAFKLDTKSGEQFIQIVGEARRRIVSSMIYSPEYNNATEAQKQKLYKDALSKANAEGQRDFLAHGVIDSTDPQTIQNEAVVGFHTQGTAKDRAYWIALLDRAGKLTSEVKAAINDSQVAAPGQKAPISADEYLEAAPLVHEYLSHVPFGTDKSPLGTPVDWAAVQKAHDQKNVLRDQYVRSGVNPSVADVKAQQDVLKSLTSLTQRSLFLNGTQVENPLRKALAKKYPTLSRFLGVNANYVKESDAEYRNFPFGAP